MGKKKRYLIYKCCITYHLFKRQVPRVSDVFWFQIWEGRHQVFPLVLRSYSREHFTAHLETDGDRSLTNSS